jgi:hypothetical protein
MKDRYTIIKEEFNSTTGETVVVINTDIGAFTGKTVLDNIDAEYPSLYHSHELALAKALRKYAKQMVVVIKEKMQPLNAVLNQCLYVAAHSEEIVYGKATYLIKKELAKLEKDLAMWKNRVSAMSKTITDRIETRDRLVKTYIQKDKKD